MNVSVIVATYGDLVWQRIASRAISSVELRNGDQLVTLHTPQGTVAQARNLAAEDATCDWLCFLDADDELEPGYLDAMQATFEQCLSKRPLLVPMVRRIHPKREETIQKIADSMDVPRAILGDMEPVATIPNQGKWPHTNECVIGTLVHRDLFSAVGGFRDKTDDGEQILMYEDWDLWLRCWNSGAQLVYVLDAVYREHVSPHGRNTNAHLSQQVYDAIWRDYENDRVVLGRE